MSVPPDSLAGLVEQIRRKAPEYLDLFTAQTEAEFDRAFLPLLEKAVAGLEANKNNFEKLDEVGLSGVLALAMSVPGLTVTQETDSNGHVDLTMTADHCVPARKKLGEAKIYAGYEYHVKGLEQLLGRYTTGREGGGLLIEYFRNNNIAMLVRRLRADMNAALPSRQQGPTTDHTLKWSFNSAHAHDCGENLTVAHIGCNLSTGAAADAGADAAAPAA